MAFITDINKILEIVLNDDSEEDIDLGDGSGSENALDSDWEYEEEDIPPPPPIRPIPATEIVKNAVESDDEEMHINNSTGHNHQFLEPAAINSNEFVTSSSSVILGQTFIVLS